MNKTPVIFFILFCLNLFFTTQLFSQTNYSFERGYGTAYDDEGLAMCSDGSFGFVTAGYSKGFSAGTNKDIYLVHFNDHGKVIWSNHLDDGLDESAAGIIRNSNGDYFVVSNKTGTNSSLIILNKVNSNGNFQMTKRFQNPSSYNQTAHGIILLSNGNIAICGTETHTTISQTDSIGLILITDQSGNILYTKKYSFDSGTEFTDLILTLDNKIAICGSSHNSTQKNILLVKSALNGDTLWTRKYSYNYSYIYVNAITQTKGGKYVIGGTEPGTYGNAFYHCVDNTGNNVIFHTHSTVLADGVMDLTFINGERGIISADGYYNFIPNMALQDVDTTTGAPINLYTYLDYPAYSFQYIPMITQSNAILSYENPITHDNFITLTGSTKFSSHGDFDVAIVHTDNVYTTKCRLNVPMISPKTPTTICPGDSVLISLDSNSYTYKHWINVKYPGNIDLGVYNDSIWVKDSGYYYMIEMDQDSSIWISNEVRVAEIDTTAPVITPNGNTSFCFASGQTLSLSITTHSGFHYQWLKDGIAIPGDTLSLINVTTSGNYICRKSCICGNFDSQPLMVNAQGNIPFPMFTHIASYIPWCNELTPSNYWEITMPGNGNYNYQWYINGNPIPSSNNRRLNINSAGMYTCMIYDLCDSLTTSQAYVGQTPLPKPNASQAHPCIVNDTITLTAINLPPGVTFLNWNYFNSPIPGANTNIYQAVQSGIYSFEFSSASCWNSPIISDTVTVAPGPVALPNFSIQISDTVLCVNDNSFMFSNLAGYTIYYERNGLPFVATSSTVPINQGGTYHAYIKNNCDTVYSNTIQVTTLPVFHLDLGNDTLVCFYQNVLLDAGPGFDHYFWSNGDTTQTILANGGPIPDSVDYIVNVIDSNHCLYEDTVMVIFDLCAGITQSNANSILISPNPSNDRFYFSNSYIEDAIIKIELYDVFGRTILRTDKSEIDMSGFSKGIYCYTVFTRSGGKYSGKLIKE